MTCIENSVRRDPMRSPESRARKSAAPQVSAASRPKRTPMRPVLLRDVCHVVRAARALRAILSGAGLEGQQNRAGCVWRRGLLFSLQRAEGSSTVGHRMLSLRTAAFALLAASGAFAGTISIKVNSTNSSTATFNRADCEAQKSINFSWDLGQALPSGATQSARISRDTSCSSTNGVELSITGSSSTGSTYSVAVPVRQMLLDTSGSDAGTLGCDAAVSSSSPGQVYFCVQTFSGSTTTAADQGSVTVKYALLDPTPPVDVKTEPGDNHLRVSWTQGSTSETIATYDVYALPDADGGDFNPDKPAVRTVNTTNTDVDKTDDGQDLQNDVTYRIAVRAVDTYGNISGLSDAGTGTPVAVDDFYERYRRAGGAASGGGGCTSVPVEAWAASLSRAPRPSRPVARRSCSSSSSRSSRPRPPAPTGSVRRATGSSR